MTKLKLACLEEHILLSDSFPETFRTGAVLTIIAIQTQECISLKQTKCMHTTEFIYLSVIYLVMLSVTKILNDWMRVSDELKRIRKEEYHLLGYDAV
jgi:hypothetical protein